MAQPDPAPALGKPGKPVKCLNVNTCCFNDKGGPAGLLFIDMETPNRVCVQGNATLSRDDPALSDYPGAKMIVRVDVTSCFLNCARYIHKHTRVSASPYVPDEKGEQPHPSWKRIDMVQESLPETARARTAAEGGTITFEEYVEKLVAGES